MPAPTWSDPSRPSLGTFTYRDGEEDEPGWLGAVRGDGSPGEFDGLIYGARDESLGRWYEVRIAVAEPAGGADPAPPSDAAAALLERIAADQTGFVTAAPDGFLAETRGEARGPDGAVRGNMWWTGDGGGEPSEFEALWEEELADELEADVPTDAAELRPWFGSPSLVIHDAGPDRPFMRDEDDNGRPVAEPAGEFRRGPPNTACRSFWPITARTVIGTGYSGDATTY